MTRWLLVWSVLLALSATPVEATMPGYNGRIAFQCEEDICLVNVDGSAVERFVSGYLPAWAPDGRRLAFARGYGDVFVIGADGEGLRQVLDSPEGERGSLFSIHSLTWSRDGERLIFVFRRRFIVLNVATGKVQELGDAPEPAYAWSPDERRIAFSRFDPYAYTCTTPAGFSFRNGCTPSPPELWLMNSDGTASRRLAHPTSGDRPDWSPDGERILYSPGHGVRAIRPDGTPLDQPALNVGLRASWSPDGTRFVFVDPEAYIRVMDADGQGASTAITGPWGAAGQPVWQPLAEIATLSVRGRSVRVHCAQSCAFVMSVRTARGGLLRLIDGQIHTTGSRTIVLSRGRPGRLRRLRADVLDAAGNSATLRRPVRLR